MPATARDPQLGRLCSERSMCSILLMDARTKCYVRKQRSDRRQDHSPPQSAPGAQLLCPGNAFLSKTTETKRFAHGHAQSLTLSSLLIIDLGCSGRYLVGSEKAKGPLQWRRQVANRQAVCRHLRRVA